MQGWIYGADCFYLLQAISSKFCGIKYTKKELKESKMARNMGEQKPLLGAICFFVYYTRL
jgi:hypothetical protein